MNLTHASLSHIGMKRETNEDRCHPEPGSAEPLPPPALARQKGQLFIVADGMGGMAAGEVASQMAVETIVNEFYGASEETSPAESLVLAVKAANFEIRTYASGSESLNGMGTTATALVVRDGKAHIAHVGDSRAYLYREGQLRQLTEDHSWVAEQVKAGILTAEQARAHPSRHMIARALGVQPHAQVDALTLPLRPGDTLLLCTDGLTNHVPDPEIAEVISADAPPTAICETLVAQANQRGGEDNITLVVIQCEPGAARRGVGTTRRISRVAPLARPLRKIPYVVLAVLLAGAVLWGVFVLYLK